MRALLMALVTLAVFLSGNLYAKAQAAGGFTGQHVTVPAEVG